MRYKSSVNIVNGITTILTAPVDKKIKVVSIYVSNTDISPQNFNISIKKSGGDTGALLKSQPVPPGSLIQVISDPIILEYEDELIVDSDTPDVINIEDRPTEFPPEFHTHNWVEIANKPDFATVSTTGSYSDLLDQPTLFSGDYTDLANTPLLFSGDYNDLSNKPTIPIIKRQELISGTTNASGNFSGSFSSSFTTPPNFIAQIIGGLSNQTLLVTNLTTSGFTVKVVQRNSVSILGIEVLLATTVNVNGAVVHIIATEF